MNNHMRNALGAITPDQVSRANQMVEALSQRLSRQVAILRQAESAGFDAQLLGQLRSRHAALLAQLQDLTNAVPSLSTSAFDEWVARARGVESQVAEFEAQTQAQLPGAERKRTGVIVASTIVALALAGGAAALIWYTSEGRG